MDRYNSLMEEPDPVDEGFILVKFHKHTGTFGTCTEEGNHR
jgi:hypothetical protein